MLADSTLYGLLDSNTIGFEKIAQDHRCSTPPRPPSTALEAYALYVCWESRLPKLRRTNTLRLLEGVIAHKTFTSPPATRFSKVIENHLFLAWSLVPVAAETARKRETQERGVGSGDSGSGKGVDDGDRWRPRPLCASPERDAALENALGLSILSSSGAVSNEARSSADGDTQQVFPDSGQEHGGDRNCHRSGDGSTTTEPTVVDCEAGTRDTSNPLDTSNALHRDSLAVENKRDEEDTEDTSQETGPNEAREGESEVEVGGDGSGGTSHGFSLEMEPFSRVYSGLYRNLAEAKGVPSGYKSRTTKSIYEGMYYNCTRVGYGLSLITPYTRQQFIRRGY